MNDLEKFLELYRELGIDLVVNIDDGGHNVVVMGQGQFLDGFHVTASPKIDGHLGCFSILVFDADGIFQRQIIKNES